MFDSIQDFDRFLVHLESDDVALGFFEQNHQEVAQTFAADLVKMFSSSLMIFIECLGRRLRMSFLKIAGYSLNWQSDNSKRFSTSIDDSRRFRSERR